MSARGKRKTKRLHCVFGHDYIATRRFRRLRHLAWHFRRDWEYADRGIHRFGGPWAAPWRWWDRRMSAWALVAVALALWIGLALGLAAVIVAASGAIS